MEQRCLFPTIEIDINMPYEIELKLLIAPQDVEKFMRHDLLLRHTIKFSTQTSHNTYYDTHDNVLQKNGYALRIRRVNEIFLLTVKGAEQIKDGLFQRQEWEYKITNAQLDFSGLPLKLQQFLMPLQPKLQPIFNTNFTRREWTVKFYHTTIEVALDQGEIIAGNKKELISEVELELFSGEIVELLIFADRLKKEINLIESNLSKAARGYQLAKIN